MPGLAVGDHDDVLIVARVAAEQIAGETQDANGDRLVTVDELLLAVNVALSGC